MRFNSYLCPSDCTPNSVPVRDETNTTTVYTVGHGQLRRYVRHRRGRRSPRGGQRACSSATAAIGVARHPRRHEPDVRRRRAEPQPELRHLDRPEPSAAGCSRPPRSRAGPTSSTPTPRSRFTMVLGPVGIGRPAPHAQPPDGARRGLLEPSSRRGQFPLRRRLGAVHQGRDHQPGLPGPGHPCPARRSSAPISTEHRRFGRVGVEAPRSS